MTGFQGVDQAQIQLQQDEPDFSLRPRDVVKAGEMECFVLWDSVRQLVCPLDLASYPVTAAALKDARLSEAFKDTKGLEGKWESLFRVGFVLDASKSTRFLVADARSSHDWVARCLFGQTLPLPQRLLELVTHTHARDESNVSQTRSKYL